MLSRQNKMATGGRSTKASVHDFLCLPCSDDGKNTEAAFKCDDCQTFYCQRCLDFHSKFVKNHTILDVNAAANFDKTQTHRSASPQAASSADMCEEHDGKNIEMYCQLHDEVCCTVCIAVKHRSCTGVKFIPNIAKSLLRAKDTEKVKSNLREVTRDLQELKSKQSAFLKELGQQRSKITNEIRQFNEQLMKKIQELERSSISEVEKRYQIISDDISHDIDRVDQMLNSAEKYFNKITKTRYDDDDVTVFINVKLAERHISKRQDWKTELYGKPLERIDFTLNPNLERYVKDVESMGTLKVSRRTIAPFVNILVPFPTGAVESLRSSIQSDLLRVGVRSKFIDSFEMDVDVYNVVIIADMTDLNELHVERAHHWKMILLYLEERRSFMDKLSGLMKVPSGDEIRRFITWANVTAKLFISFTYEWNKFIFSQSDKAIALEQVADIINK